MDVVKATQAYEDWLGTHIALVAKDIALKHKCMHDSRFAFLRATYYRWIGLWRKHCAELDAAPRVLSVGDLHIENFGTWRDAEGRLAWGIDDFDEAGEASYANDLVRLAASLLVAVDEGSLSFDGKKACAAMLEGYTAAIGAKTETPFVLEEDHPDLRDLAMSGVRGPRKFWKKIRGGDTVTPPPDAGNLLVRHLPRATVDVVYTPRTAGMGGLGVPRFVAFGAWHGGLVAREAKARAPTARSWADKSEPKLASFQAILRQAVRVPDPFLQAAPGWIIRRVAPHCERIDLDALQDGKLAREVLSAMGAEAANVHWGNRAAVKRIVKDLASRKPSWLHHHAAHMADATVDDWRSWRKGR